jgi:ADP-ribose pyrophosphatase
MASNPDETYPKGKLLERNQVYSGKIVDLIVDEIELSGVKHIREVVRHPGGVVVIGELDDGRIPFVRQRRYPMDRVLLELPAGKIDPGEPPELSAAREMEEETGYRPERLNHVFSFYATPGFCDELLHLYHTDQLIATEPRLEADEDLEIEFYTLDEALEMANRGQILDAKTLTAIFWLKWRKTR